MRTNSGAGDLLFLSAANKRFFKRASDMFLLFSFSLSLAFRKKADFHSEVKEVISQHGISLCGATDGVHVYA